MAERYGAEMSVPDWKSRLVCGQCGSRRVDMVVSGTERRDSKARPKPGVAAGDEVRPSRVAMGKA